MFRVAVPVGVEKLIVRAAVVAPVRLTVNVPVVSPCSVALASVADMVTVGLPPPETYS